MDLLGLGFLLGIVGAGFGAVLQQVISGHFRATERRRALLSEIEENLSRIGNEDEIELRYPLSIGRSSWELAREIDLPASLRELLTRAYSLGERLNDNVATANAYYAATATPSRETVAAVMETQAAMGRNARAIAKQTREAFSVARDELKRLDRPRR